MRMCKNRGMREFWNHALILALAFALTAIPMAAAASDAVLPAKTRLILQLNNDLSTRVNGEGDSFSAYVTKPVSVGDRIVIPKGSIVTGSVSRIVRPGRFKGRAVLNLIFQSVTIPGRGQFPLVASLSKMDSQVRGTVRSEGTLEGDEGNEGNEMRKALAPGISRAGIGTLPGGVKSNAIGSGFFAPRGEEIEISRGATLNILLDQPLKIPLD